MPLNFNNETYTYQDVFEKNSGHLKAMFYKKEILPLLYSNPGTRDAAFSLYKKFRKIYPTMAAWLQEKIGTRIGKDKIRLERTEGLNYRARPYIQVYFLFTKADPAYLFNITGLDTLYRLIERKSVNYGTDDILLHLKRLGYSQESIDTALWGFYRLMLLTGKKHYSEITLQDIDEFIQKGLEHKGAKAKNKLTTSMYILQQALYSANIVKKPPVSGMNTKEYKLEKDIKSLKHPKMLETMDEYYKSCSAGSPASTVNKKPAAGSKDDQMDRNRI